MTARVTDYGDRLIVFADDTPDAPALVEAVKGRPGCGWSVRWTDQAGSHWHLADRKSDARRVMKQVASALLEAAAADIEAGAP
jgi:hypothetical protein